MQEPSLDQQLREYQQHRFLAMPLAGLIAWAFIGVLCWIFAERPVIQVWTLFIGTGCIAYLGMFLSKFTGEHFLKKRAYKNYFEKIFFRTVLMSFTVYAIAIPFFLSDYSSLPLSIAILTGLMWLPQALFMQHWVPYFHVAARTLGVLVLWYALPEHRFVAIPAFVVAIYLVTIIILEQRWRQLKLSA